ncbi:MAG: amidohydrolase, partial [Candidatus Eisenbacteria bacterium]|nr:amidohydrolase [Candidatus Eisenbacteria bacterium]
MKISSFALSFVAFLLFSATLVTPASAEEKEKWDISEADLGPTKTLRWTVDEGTWMDLDVSPDGKWIVFDLLGDIYKLPITGGKAQAIRTGPAYEVQPRFSPDGSEIAFTSDAGGGDNIWIMDNEGAEARQLTKESFRLLNNPVWSPDGKTIVARKHFTSGRSLGAGEMWMYDVTAGGSGVQLTKKPNDQKDVNEPEFSADGKYLFYTIDSTPGSRFEYNKDPNTTIYTLRRIDLTTGKEITVANQAGSTLRPEASPDGKYLAFVRRVRTKSVLMVQDLETGLQRPVYDGLSQDMQETWSIFGTYPGFGWTPDSKSVVIWAKGKLQRINIDSGEATPIPFEADLRAEVVDALRFKQKFGQEDFDVHVARWATPSPNGDQVVFQALGYLWIRDIGGGTPRRLTNDTHFEYYPTWSPDGSQIIYSTWNDQTGGRINSISLRGGTQRTLVDEPGHYAYPSLSKDGQWLLYQRVGGDRYRGHAFTNDTGVFLKPMSGGETRKVTTEGSRPQFDADDDRILLFSWSTKKKTLFSVDFLGGNRREIATSERAQEMSLSPNGEWLAFRELWEVYAAPRPRTGKPIALGPKMKNLPVKKISNIAGEYLNWSADGTTLNYSLGSDLFRADIPGMFDGSSDPDSIALSWKAPTDIPNTNVVLRGAKILTMDSRGIIEDGAVHVVGNRIVAVGKSADIRPSEARDIDVRGKVLMPGLVDTHAHTGSSNNGLQAQQTWSFVANLAFGVTTTHDPSNNTTMIFATSEMAKAGNILAPRVFSTGTVLYGAEGDFKAPTESYEDALRHLSRLKAYG